MISPPVPTPILRFLHVDNLHVVLTRAGLYAPSFAPNDGLAYRTIHNASVQEARSTKAIPCGPCGVVHDYVPFYFGYLSPMMLNLKTGRVAGYAQGQEPLIYLVAEAQAIQRSGARFVFSDGHGVARITRWFDDLNDLDKVDWQMVYQRYWKDSIEDMDRQRRKQAEFLVHRFCAWALVKEIVVIDNAVKSRVEDTLKEFPESLRRVVNVRRDWYYY